MLLSIRADDVRYMSIEDAIEIWKRFYSKPNDYEKIVITPDNLDILGSWKESDVLMLYSSVEEYFLNWEEFLAANYLDINITKGLFILDMGDWDWELAEAASMGDELRYWIMPPNEFIDELLFALQEINYRDEYLRDLSYQHQFSFERFRREFMALNSRESGMEGMELYVFNDAMSNIDMLNWTDENPLGVKE